MTDDASNEAQVDRKRGKREARRQLFDGVIRNLMSTMPGRLWVWEQLSQCHIFQDMTFFESQNASLRTYFAAGERNVGLKLLADVQRLCPREYILAMEENAKLEQDNGRRSTDERSPDGSDDGDSSTD